MVGDRVLVGFTRLVLQTLGASGFLARTGGDRFGIVLPAADLTAAVEVAEGLRQMAEAAA